MATCSEDETVKIWNYWNLIYTYAKHAGYVLGLEWISKDTIASGSEDNTIQIWSITTGLIQRTKTGSIARALQLLNNGFHLASALFDGKINIYNLIDGTLVTTLLGHSLLVNDLVLIDESVFASSSADNSIRIWDSATYKQKFILKGHSSHVYGLKLTAPGILASRSVDKTIKLWNIQNVSETRTFMGHKGDIIWLVDMLNEKKTLVSGSKDKTIKLWDWKTGDCLKKIETGSDIRSLSIIKNN